MNNAEKFKQIFGLYATELWSMPEGDFLAWLNRAAETAQNVSDSDLIFRKMAIEALRECQTYLFDECDPDKKIELRSAERAIEDLPSAQPEIIRCKDCKYRYLDGMIWNCPFGLSGGEDFFCAYGAIGGGSGT